VAQSEPDIISAVAARKAKWGIAANELNPKECLSAPRPGPQKLSSPTARFDSIASNLSKAGWSWGCVAAIDSNGRTIWIVDAHCGDGKRFIAGREKESQRTRLRERPPDKRNLLPFQFNFAQLNRKTLRWEEVSEALMRHEKKARPEHDLAFWAK